MHWGLITRVYLLAVMAFVVVDGWPEQLILILLQRLPCRVPWRIFLIFSCNEKTTFNSLERRSEEKEERAMSEMSEMGKRERKKRVWVCKD